VSDPGPGATGGPQPAGDAAPAPSSAPGVEAATGPAAAGDDGTVPPAGELTKHRRGFPRTIRHLGEILVVGFLIEYFVLPQIGGTHHVLHVLATVNPFLPVGGFILEALSLVAYFQLTRSLIPKREDPGLVTMARIELSTLAVSHCVPGGNFVGASLGYGLLTKAGVEGPDAGVALATQGLGSAVMLNVIFWVSLLASLPLYGLGHGPHVLYLSAGVLGLLLMAAIAGLVVLFNKGDERATALLTSLGAKLPFLRPETLPRLFSQLAARVRQLSKDRRQLGKTIFWASANWLLDAGSLLFFVAAFGRWVNPTALLVAYGLANIAGAIPITPGGLAIIEGTLSTILVGFGTPRTIAILGVIGWRLVNFWLPIPVGGATYLSLRVHPPAPNQAGLAARRAVWRGRWRWLTELIERPAPERAIDEGLAVIESGADAVPAGLGAAVAEVPPPTPGTPSEILGGEEKGGSAAPAPGAANGMPIPPATAGEVESGTSGGAAP
jgi:uncharacterized protein (TIRG00374 family)